MTVFLGQTHKVRADYPRILKKTTMPNLSFFFFLSLQMSVFQLLCSTLMTACDQSNFREAGLGNHLVQQPHCTDEGPNLSHPKKLSEVAQSCPTLCNPMDTRLLRPWDFLGKSPGVGCHFLLQGIFPTQGSNPGLPHCR